MLYSMVLKHFNERLFGSHFHFFLLKNWNRWHIKFYVSYQYLILFQHTNRAKIYAVIGPVSEIALAINSIPGAILSAGIDE